MIDMAGDGDHRVDNVNTLRRGRALPTRLTRRTVESINASSASRPVSVATSTRPALADQVVDHGLARCSSRSVCQWRIFDSS